MGKNESLCSCPKPDFCPCGCGMCMDCLDYTTPESKEAAARSERETEVENFIDSWRKE